MKSLRRLCCFSLLLLAPWGFAAEVPDDRVIATTAQESYVYRVLLEGRVQVAVAAGGVTLSGTVLDRDLRFLAEDLAAALPGVTRVDNRVMVDTAMEERSDRWRVLMIHTRLLMRSGVSAGDIQIAVEDGVVSLHGTARDADQKALTETYAKEIQGVTAVTNRLVVRAASAPATTRPAGGETIDDPSVVAQTRYALRTHPETGRLRPAMTSADGVVTITGEAVSAAEKSLVTTIAGSVRGVASVNNTMTVKS